ncbi:MAG: Riboflavin transporter RibZ [Gemmatimonadaceae bacterium]|nr:Riboflavin transporter RibZ [Gemmatimonadaceae bacterium]
MTGQHSSRRWLVLSAIGVGTFMSALDGSVVNTLLPVMSRSLGADVAGIEWVVTVYLLVVSALLLGIGRLGDLRGHKRTYLGGFAVFVVGSALCGLAPSAGWLIALRAVQAIGATMLFANAPAILTRSFPGSERGRALGALGTFTYLGLTTGPSLGGWIAATFGWRWVFYINAPVGVIAIALAWGVVEDDRPEGRPEPFDLAGAALFTFGLVALLIALNQGHDWGWLSPRVVGLLVGATGVLLAFVALERRVRHPMLDLSLFRNGVFAWSTMSAVLNYAAVSSAIFLLPFLLIEGRGLSTRDAGLVLTAQPLVMAIVAPISGALSDRVGSRAPTTIGMLLLTAGLLLLSLLSAAAPLAAIVASLTISGLGVGIFVSPNNSALMGAAPGNRLGIASGILAEARNVGMVLGVGLAGAVFTTVLSRSGADAVASGAALVHGVQAGLLTAALVSALGIGTSSMR